MKFIEEYSVAFSNNSEIYGYPSKDLFDSVSIYIVPMINPDGVNIATNFLSTKSFGYLQAKSISNNFSNICFPSGWKANIKGESLINFHLFIAKKIM